MAIPDDLITAKAAAKLIAVSVSTIHRWKEDGTLRRFRLAGRRYRFSKADVLALVVEMDSPEPIRTTLQDEDAAAAAMARMRAAGVAK